VLEDAPRALDQLRQPVNAPRLRRLRAEGGEIVRPQVGDDARLAERRNDAVADFLVVGPHARRQLVGVHQRLFGGEEGVSQYLHGQAVGRLLAGPAASVQRVLLRVVLGFGEGGSGGGSGRVVPARAEVVERAADFLAPVTGRVRPQREVGAGLGGLVGGGGR